MQFVRECWIFLLRVCLKQFRERLRPKCVAIILCYQSWTVLFLFLFFHGGWLGELRTARAPGMDEDTKAVFGLRTCGEVLHRLT